MVQFTIMASLLLELCTCRQSQWSRKQKNRCARTCECKLQVKAEKFSMISVCSTPWREVISSCVEVSLWLNRTERGPQNGKPVDAKMRSPLPPSPNPIRSSGKPIRRCARRWPTQVKAKSTLSSDSFGLSSSQGGEFEPIVGSWTEVLSGKPVVREALI